jgi:hypothetical protein
MSSQQLPEVPEGRRRLARILAVHPVQALRREVGTQPARLQILRLPELVLTSTVGDFGSEPDRR